MSECLVFLWAEPTVINFEEASKALIFLHLGK